MKLIHSYWLQYLSVLCPLVDDAFSLEIGSSTRGPSRMLALERVLWLAKPIQTNKQTNKKKKQKNKSELTHYGMICILSLKLIVCPCLNPRSVCWLINIYDSLLMILLNDYCWIDSLYFIFQISILFINLAKVCVFLLIHLILLFILYKF